MAMRCSVGVSDANKSYGISNGINSSSFEVGQSTGKGVGVGVGDATTAVGTGVAAIARVNFARPSLGKHVVERRATWPGFDASMMHAATLAHIALLTLALTRHIR